MQVLARRNPAPTPVRQAAVVVPASQGKLRGGGKAAHWPTLDNRWSCHSHPIHLYQ